MAEVDYFKKSHSNFCDNDVLFEKSERFPKQLQENIIVLRVKLRNKDEVIHSFLQQWAKHDNIFIECNHVSSHETSDKMHFYVLSNHKELQRNTTHEELLLDTSIIVNETDNMNDATENRNLTAKTGNSSKHQQNRGKNSEQEKDKKPNKVTGKRKISCHLKWKYGKAP